MDRLSSRERINWCKMTTMTETLATKLQADGYQITAAPETTMGYTFEARRNGDAVAVLVKDHRAKVNVAHIQRFQEYLGLDVARRFTAGWMMSASGFSNPALTHVKTEEPANLRLGTF